MRRVSLSFLSSYLSSFLSSFLSSYLSSYLSCLHHSMSDEDREEGVPPSKTTLCGEHESQTKAQSPEQQHSPHSAGPGPGPGPRPGPGPSCLSMKSNKSRDLPLKFKQSVDGRIQQQRPDSPEPSCLSLKSDKSKDLILVFRGQRPSADQIVDQESSEVPSGQSAQQHQTHLDSIFMNELKKMQKVLSQITQECRVRGDEEVLGGEDEGRGSREEFLKITLNFLRE
ncbi:protein NLRC3-like protein [Lates japonicus]|uniref:Protein NLRC3-like protein n=1 Tax=Lates japonicus TaxID=270547 RepID=A0AAD3RHA2_LATJO|nr:protein NLRC3-like protein [Lates japonicus]